MIIGKAKDVFSLQIKCEEKLDGESYSLINDGENEFWVYTSSLDEEVEIPEPPCDQTDVFSEWVVTSMLDDDQVAEAGLDCSGGQDG